MKTRKYQGYIIDLDGTIYRQKEKIPQAPSFINYLLKNKIKFRLMTNNTTRTPQAIQNFLQKYHQIVVPQECIYTAALATADYLEKINKKVNPGIYVIGENGLKTEIYKRGFIYNEINPDYVVIGLDTDVTYHKFKTATLAIEKGAQFIGTNPDRVIPTEDGLIPSAGALINLVATATNQQPLIIGKPKTVMLELIAQELSIPLSQLIIFGDNYQTDIKAGLNFKIATALVLTGVTSLKDLKNIKEQPSYVLDQLGEWHFV